MRMSAAHRTRPVAHSACKYVGNLRHPLHVGTRESAPSRLSHEQRFSVQENKQRTPDCHSGNANAAARAIMALGPSGYRFTNDPWSVIAISTRMHRATAARLSSFENRFARINTPTTSTMAPGMSLIHNPVEIVAF